MRKINACMRGSNLKFLGITFDTYSALVGSLNLRLINHSEKDMKAVNIASRKLVRFFDDFNHFIFLAYTKRIESTYRGWVLARLNQFRQRLSQIKLGIGYKHPISLFLKQIQEYLWTI